MSAKNRRSARSIRPLSVLSAAALTAMAAFPLGGVASAETATPQAKTPIEHVVVIYPENISFDHYFGTYPKAANKDGETLQGSGDKAPTFTAKPGTPKDVDNLVNSGLDGKKNPNSVKPFRLSPEQAATVDQNHEYSAEQYAMNGGKMDKFADTLSNDVDKKSQGLFGKTGLTMGYYDGNTVTGMWNYAQNFAMSDNSFSSIFGPSTPGALNLVGASSAGATIHDPATGEKLAIEPGSNGEFVPNPEDHEDVAIVGDPDPLYDDCSNDSSASTDEVAQLHNKNIGDQLNEKGITWGWFQGGFKPTEEATEDSRARCGSAHETMTGQTQTDYNPHHQPFVYYASTANPHHLPPSSVDMIGKTDQANHQYDTSDFDAALANGNLPAVSFLKAPNYQDGHAGYSNPLDEQAFITHNINELQNSDEWDSTAVIIAYDDSDGWYDHKPPKILNGSNDKTIVQESGEAVDAEICTDAAKKVGVADGVNGQCGPGTRQPLLAISAYAKVNSVDHTYTEQASVTRFIQDNWDLGRLGENTFDNRAGSLENMFDFSEPKADKLFLNETDGTVASSYDAVKRVDDSSRATEELKPVAEGMNDPKITEMGLDQIENASTMKATNSSNTGTYAAVLGGIIAVVVAVVTFFMARRSDQK